MDYHWGWIYVLCYVSEVISETFTSHGEKHRTNANFLKITSPILLLGDRGGEAKVDDFNVEKQSWASADSATIWVRDYAKGTMYYSNQHHKVLTSIAFHLSDTYPYLGTGQR